MTSKIQNLALFDFDGTITRGDSFFRFILYTIKRTKLLSGIILLSPQLISYMCGIISNEKVKQIVFRYFFSGWLLQDIETISYRFVNEIIPSMCKENVLERLRWHLIRNHRIVIVSASFEFYLKPFCENFSVELLGTQIQVSEGRITGSFSSLNCYGAEKVSRILSHLNLNEYYVYAYGNSRGDFNMLELADESFLVKNNNIMKYVPN